MSHVGRWPASQTCWPCLLAAEMAVAEWHSHAVRPSSSMPRHRGPVPQWVVRGWCLTCSTLRLPLCAVWWERHRLLFLPEVQHAFMGEHFSAVCLWTVPNSCLWWFVLFYHWFLRKGLRLLIPLLEVLSSSSQLQILLISMIAISWAHTLSFCLTAFLLERFCGQWTFGVLVGRSRVVVLSLHLNSNDV